MSVSRNAPCPCGSGKKFKRCCGQNENSRNTAASGNRSSANLEFQFNQAMQYYQQGELDKAATICNQMLQQTQDYAPVLELGAVIALQSGDSGNAINLLGRQLALQPENAYAHNNLCMVLHEIGRDEEAYGHCQQALKIMPSLAEAHNNLGNIYKSRHHLQDALACYNKAIELGIADPRVYVNAGLSSQLLGDVEAAEQRYREILERYPDFQPALNNLGALLLKLKRLDEAKEVLQRANQIAPDDYEIVNNLGAVWLELGDREQARESFEKALELNPGHVGTQVNLGLLDDEEGHADIARERYLKILEFAPDNADAHYNLAVNYMTEGRHAEAVEHYSYALKSDPYFGRAMAGLGEAMLSQDQLPQAKKLIERAVELSPYDALIQRAKAKYLSEKRDNESAEKAWRELTEEQPSFEDGYCGLAALYESQERFEDARRVYQQALEVIPENLLILQRWSALEEQTHNLDKALELAGRAAKHDEANPSLLILKAKLARRGKDYKCAIDLLRTIEPDAISNYELRSAYLFELAGNYDKLGRYDEAFSAYESANEYKNLYLGRVYSEESDKHHVEKLQSVFSAENWKRFKSITSIKNKDEIIPIFIVGFPRSGTSLLEQIIGSHPQIAPAGELRFVPDITGGKCRQIIGSEKPWPECLLDEEHPLTEESLRQMRDYYLEQVADLGVADSQTVWVSDKMPHNALNVGLISLLFPESPIIHISRHPFNSCLSAYFANFISKHRYTSSLEATAKHYRNMMETLEHYKQTLDMKFLQIRYEDLVEDQETTTRQVLEFIGAPWDERCLQHHKSDRVVRTASYEQVTQKIYRSSLYRYRNYWKHVEPLIPILKTTIEKFGYELE